LSDSQTTGNDEYKAFSDWALNCILTEGRKKSIHPEDWETVDGVKKPPLPEWAKRKRRSE